MNEKRGRVARATSSQTGRRVKRIELQKRESGEERTSRNKTVISRHFTHERERLADSTCVPALGCHGETILSFSLLHRFPLLPLPSLFLSFSITYTLAQSSLKNTALADTCSFDVLHMCVRTLEPAHRGNEGQKKKIIAQENFHKTSRNDPSDDPTISLRLLEFCSSFEIHNHFVSHMKWIKH